MAEARLKTEIWVQTAVRRANVDGGIVTVVAKGDPTAGSVLVKINRFADGCRVLAETRDANGERAWYVGTGAEAVDEPTADAYIERARKRDPDLWVVEVEDRTGRLPFEGKILAT